MDLQVEVMQSENYCLLSKKPDNAKSIKELEEELILVFKDGIEVVRASYGGIRKRP